jgi:hypothetical protein
VRLTVFVRALHFVDPADQRVASTVHATGWLLVMLASAWCLMTRILGTPVELSLAGAAVALCGLASQWMVWRGHLRSAVWVLAMAVWLALAAAWPGLAGA